MKDIELIPEFEEILDSNWQEVVLTDEQQAIIEKAVEVLNLYDKEEVSYDMYYFENEEEHAYDSEYDTCTKTDCIEASIKAIKENEGGVEVTKVYTYNNSDQEDIKLCSVCECPLNDTLTWVKYEWDCFKDDVLTIQDIQTSYKAFALKVIFESIPSCDHRLSNYSRNDREFAYMGLQAQKDLYTAIVAKAQEVIDVHSSIPII